jgi:hypothetical protein
MLVILLVLTVILPPAQMALPDTALFRIEHRAVVVREITSKGRDHGRWGVNAAGARRALRG